jgi:hypothetical protein
MSTLLENSPENPAKGNLLIVNEDIESVSTSTLRYLKKHAIKIFICMVLAEGLIFLAQPEDKTLYIAPLVVLVAWYLFTEFKVRNEFMQQFAQVNGYTYQAHGECGNAYLFQVGHDNAVTDQVAGTYNGYPIQVYFYSYVIGYGKGSHLYTNSVFSLEFDTAMPDIVLINKKNFWDGQEHSLFPATTEVLKLEGDFNNYFELHVPKGYEMEALEVFTPDVMSALIDKAQGFNMEISKNSIFIYTQGFINTKEKLYAMYEFAEYMTSKLGPVLAGMKSSLEVMNSSHNISH